MTDPLKNEDISSRIDNNFSFAEKTKPYPNKNSND